MNDTRPSPDIETAADCEVVRIPSTTSSCSLCEDYALSQAAKPVAILSCEGGCLRGEISRRSANVLCLELMRESTVRICLGGAFTKNAGQRDLVRNAKRVVALEGCPIDCASRMVHGVLPDVPIEVIRTDRLAQFDKQLFAIDAMTDADVRACAHDVAAQLAERLNEVDSAGGS